MANKPRFSREIQETLRLEYLRLSRHSGMNIAQIAEKLGVSYDTAQKWRVGNYPPPWAIRVLADRAGLKIEIDIDAIDPFRRILGSEPQ